jgi:hypothetical protein
MLKLNKKCIIIQISEGLGNQLFCYAAARGLSLKNNVPLYLDTHSQYRVNHYDRKYLLDNYYIKGTKLDKATTFVGNIGHLLWKIKAFKKNFNIFYFEQKNQFDQGLLSKQISGIIYLFGYWQHEEYFKDYSDEIRNDLKRKNEPSEDSKAVARKIKAVTSVSVHVRSYREVDGKRRISKDYFEKAMEYVSKRVENPVFFIFSDDHQWVSENLLINGVSVPVAVNKYLGNTGALDDLWLMSLCEHHILSSSSFSWWGAWLANKEDGIVVLPENSDLVRNGTFLKKWILL